MGNQFEEWIAHGNEERNLEYKESISWDDPLIRAKLTKTMLALSNLRDGGVIVIGVKENAGRFVPVGVTSDHAKSFTQDDVTDYVNGFADPFIEVTVAHVQYDTKDFIVIQVKEFDELPVISKKETSVGGARGKAPDCTLRRGAMYVRGRRKAQTLEVSSQTEMREILDLAIEKGIRSLLAKIDRLGISVGKVSESADSAYDAELGDLNE